MVTQAGLELGDMVGSAFIIETVFAWPGIGRMTVNAVQQRDFLVVQGCVLVTATAFVLINLLVDLLYAAIDPRVRSTRMKFLRCRSIARRRRAPALII